jgi:A/G-specific adenine glycosylase
MPNKHNLTVPFAPGDFQEALLRWYDVAQRELPWRAKPGATPDPYSVWLSEIMLQQTTVKAVIPYFETFLDRWPTVEALGAASRDEVLAAWAGLGYYSRARNLHSCAQMVARSGFLADEEGLRKLPGIGAYTAAAIAAIAFGQPAAAVDGNVERVLARLFALPTPLPAAKPSIRALAKQLLSQKRPGDYAQAMMDLGATVCTPRSPSCLICPVSAFCVAFRQHEPERFPVKAPKAPRPVRRGDAFVIVRDAETGPHILLRRRPESGLLGGMMEVPCTPWVSDLGPPAPANKGVKKSSGQRQTRLSWPDLIGPSIIEWEDFSILMDGRVKPGHDNSGGSDLFTSNMVPSNWTQAETVRHTFTHFHLEMRVFAALCAQVQNEAQAFNGDWAALSSLPRYGLPTVMKKAAASGLAVLGIPMPK